MKSAEEMMEDIGAALESALMNLNPPCEDDEELRHRTKQYFNLCKETKTMATFEGLAVHLGTSIDEMKQWCKGEGCTKVRKDILQNALGILQNQDIFLVTRGVLPQVVYIWRSKQYYGMREPSSRLEVSGGSPLKDLPSVAGVKAKYLKDAAESEEEPQKED